MCLHIGAMTADSSNPNWASIASKAVRSSQAISTMPEMLAMHNIDPSLRRKFLELFIG